MSGVTFCWRRIGEYEDEWTERAEARKARYLTAGEVCKALLWPTPCMKERVFISPGFSAVVCSCFLSTSNYAWSLNVAARTMPCVYHSICPFNIGRKTAAYAIAHPALGEQLPWRRKHQRTRRWHALCKCSARGNKAGLWAEQRVWEMRYVLDYLSRKRFVF